MDERSNGKGTAIDVDEARTGPTFTEAHAAQIQQQQQHLNGGGADKPAVSSVVAKSFMEMVDALHGDGRNEDENELDRARNSSSVSVVRTCASIGTPENVADELAPFHCPRGVLSTGSVLSRAECCCKPHLVARSRRRGRTA